MKLKNITKKLNLGTIENTKQRLYDIMDKIYLNYQRMHNTDMHSAFLDLCEYFDIKEIVMFKQLSKSIRNLILKSKDIKECEICKFKLDKKFILENKIVCESCFKQNKFNYSIYKLKQFFISNLPPNISIKELEKLYPYNGYQIIKNKKLKKLKYQKRCIECKSIFKTSNEKTELCLNCVIKKLKQYKEKDEKILKIYNEIIGKEISKKEFRNIIKKYSTTPVSIYMKKFKYLIDNNLIRIKQ